MQRPALGPLHPVVPMPFLFLCLRAARGYSNKSLILLYFPGPWVLASVAERATTPRL